MSDAVAAAAVTLKDVQPSQSLNVGNERGISLVAENRNDTRMHDWIKKEATMTKVIALNVKSILDHYVTRMFEFLFLLTEVYRQ